jgi:hypothetical protein
MKPNRPVRTLSLLLAATVAALVAVAPAYAGQVVFDRGDDLYVMNDDGTGARALLTASQAPNTDDIIDPSTGPVGTRVVFSALRSDGDPVNCGSNCISVFLLDDGVLRRLSAAPGPTGGNVNTYANDPELSLDGAFTFFSNAVNILSPSSLKAELGVYQNSDGATAEFDTGCDDARNPAPRPDATDEVVYACDDDRTLYRTGADPQVAGDDVPLFSDDVTPTDPSFSADGNTIVDAEGGADAGLWAFAYDASVVTHVVQSPAGTPFSSPRFAGARILFVADRDVWSVPATCTQATCSFPASATQLTTSGDVGAIGWTSSTTPVKALTTAPPPTNTTTPTTTTTTPTTTTTTTTTTPPVAPGVTGFSLAGTAKKLKAALKGGVKVRAGCDQPCALAGKAFIDAKTAKRYRLGKKKIAVASGGKTGVTSATTLTLKFTAKAKKRLAKAKKLKLSVELTATASGLTSTKKGSLTLKK